MLLYNDCTYSRVINRIPLFNGIYIMSEGMKYPASRDVDKSDLPTSDSITKKAKQYKMEKILMGQFGIEETADLVIAVAAFANATGEALEDGVITLSDLPLLLDPAVKLPAAFSGISEVPKELGELDEAEKNELLVLVAGELDFSENTEEVVTRALIIISDIKDLIDYIKLLNPPKV